MNACTTLDTGLPDRTVLEKILPPSVELENTPFFPQTAHQCGPAALATVLQSYRLDVTPESLSSRLYIPERKGSLQVEIAVAARQYDMLPYPLQPDISTLLKEIAAGNPVLVLQNLRFEWWPQWHYAVVIGYDLEQDELILRSGESRRWLTSINTFITTWNRADNWALVVVPAGTIPATAETATYLKTAYAFEETGMTRNALEAYRGATHTWPQLADAWLMLGTLAYKAGYNTQAVDALLQASRLDADSALVWNNLAYALHRSGCASQSRKSLQCARQRSADASNIHDSEQEIRRMAVDTRPKNCPEITCNQATDQVKYQGP